MRCNRILSLGLLPLSLAVLAAQPLRSPDDALLDVLVFGPHMRVNPKAYSPALRAELEAYVRRAKAYRTALPFPPALDINRMVYDARVAYERKLAAISAKPGVWRLARAYVKDLRLCYEWEGSSDCPEREALVADWYQAAHPGGPFSAYLPLHSAHRWLCAAEGYEYEQRPEDASHCMYMYVTRLEVALQSKVLLMRTAAKRLSVRRRGY